MKKKPWKCGGKIFLELGSEALVLLPAGALLPLSKLPVSFSCQVWKIIPLRQLAQGIQRVQTVRQLEAGKQKRLLLTRTLKAA